MKKECLIRRPHYLAQLCLLTASSGALLAQTVEAAYASSVPATDDTDKARPVFEKQHKTSRTYTVQPGDTLEKIAKHVRVKDLHRSQIIVALFQSNPQAFSQHNLHHLKAGAILHAPKREITKRFTPKEAQDIIRAYATPEQHQSQAIIQNVETTHLNTNKIHVDNLQKKLAEVDAKLQTETQQLEQQQAQLGSTLTSITREYDRKIAQLTRKRTTTAAQYQHQEQQLIQQTRRLQGDKSHLLSEKQQLQQTNQVLTPIVQKALFVIPQDYQNVADSDDEVFFRKTVLRNRMRSPYSPLLAKAEALYCAVTEGQAQPVLHSLLSDAEPGTTWPDEWLGNQQKPGLYAGTMDILLATLERTSVRFPALREDVERVALQWNYCDMLDGEQFYNLKMREERAERLLTDSLPLQGHGFRRWGFMLQDPVDRFIPRIINEIRLAPHAYQYFLHRAYRKQCFPHPVTGKRYPEEDREKLTNPRNALPPSLLVEKQDHAYPYEWFPHCEAPKVVAPTTPTWSSGLLRRISATTVKIEEKQQATEQRIEQLQQQKTALQKTLADITTKLDKNIAEQQQQKAQKLRTIERELQRTLAAIERKQTAATELKRTTEHHLHLAQQAEKEARLRAQQRREAEARAREAEQERQRLAQEAERKRQAEQERLAAERRQQAAEAIALEEHRQRYNQPKADDIVMPVSRSGDTSIYWEDPKKIKTAAKAKTKTKHADQDGKEPRTYKLKLSGSISHNTSISSKNHTLSGSVNWSPHKNWFVNASGSYQYGPNNPRGFSYAWNAGYSDWRPGSMSFRLDNWGPLKRGEGLALDKAVFGASYKFDSDVLRKYKLGGGLSYSYPLHGNSSGNLGMSMQYNITKEWYFRTAVSKSIDGGKPTWTYGFGKYNWRPNIWRYEYSNYGKNEYPFDNLNKGTISISRGWQKEWDIPLPSIVRKPTLPSPAQQVTDAVLAPSFAQPHQLPKPAQQLLEKAVTTVGDALLNPARQVAQQTVAHVSQQTTDDKNDKTNQQGKQAKTGNTKPPLQTQGIANTPSITQLTTQASTSTQTVAQTVTQTTTQIASQAVTQTAQTLQPTRQTTPAPVTAPTKPGLNLSLPTGFKLHYQQTTPAHDPRRLQF